MKDVINRKQYLLEKIKSLVSDKTLVDELERELAAESFSVCEDSRTFDADDKFRLSTLLNNLPGMAYRCRNDENWTMLFVNSGCTDLTGFRPEDLINNSLVSFADLIHPDDREKVQEQIQAKMKNGQPFKIQYRLHDKQGDVRWVCERGQVAGKSAGGNEFIEGFITDITEQVETEKALKTSEETYHNLFHNAQVGLFRSGVEDGRVLECNEQMAKMFGYTSRDDMMKHFKASENYIHPTREEMIEEIKEKGEVQNFEARFYRNDGTEFSALYSARLNPEHGWLEGVLEDITERVKAEKQLIESEKQLKKAQEIGNTGSWKLNLRSGYFRASEEAFRICGLTPGKQYSVTEVSNLLLQEDKNRLFKAIEKLVEGRSNYDVEFRLKRSSDCQLIDVRTIAEYNPVDDTITGTIQDITNNKAAERSLQESEEMHRSLIDNSTDAIYIMYERRFEVVNKGFEKLLGYSLDELRSRNIDPIEFIAPESIPFIEERIKKLENGEYVNPRYEFTAITKNGEKRDVEASVAYIPFKEGTATQGIIRDITERKTSEKKIRDLSEFRNLLVELSTNFIHVPLEEIDNSVNKSLSRLGRFVGADRAYIFDYNFEEQYYRNTFEWCDEGISPQIENLQHIPLDFSIDLIERHRKGEIVNIPDVAKIEQVEMRRFLEDQEIKSLLTLPLFSGQACIGFVGFDAVRKYFHFSEDEIEILQVYAKILVNSFERQQREKELILAKERAEESDLLKSAFLANMSHEIRTPMNGILGFTSLLKQPKLSGEEKEEFIDIIQQSGERMLSTIDDIISISKIESGTMEVKWTGYDVEKHLNYFYRFFKPEAERKGLQLSIKENSSAKIEEIKADKDKLNAVLSNLIKNAIKYTNQGWIEIGYECKEEQIEFFVKDTGIGIKKELLNSVFDRFVQEEYSSSKPYEGVGLGLSISKGYIEMMGGKIWVESEKGEGSVFRFSLPVAANGSVTN